MSDKTGSPQSYERLEYLGDAVLELLTTKFLFDTFPDQSEGVLTAYRSALVRTETLARLATTLGLNTQVIMGKGGKKTPGTNNVNILADVMEAYIGALFLDQGYQACQVFLTQNLFPHITQIIASRSFQDAKSLFQEKIQAKGLPTPHYQVIDETGPDHHKLFTVKVVIGEKTWGKGVGSSKQRAESLAAQNALEQMG